MNLPRKSLLALLPFAALAGACQTSFEQSAQLNRNVFVTAQENVARGHGHDPVGCFVHGDGQSTETTWWSVPADMIVRYDGVRSGAVGVPDQGACAAAVAAWTGGTFCLAFSELNPLWDNWGTWCSVLDEAPPTATEYVP